MAYRVLVDENLDPETVELLRESGHEAVHVSEILGKGADDPSIADHARTHDYLVLTNDADFLRRDLRPGLRVLYVPKNSMRAHDIVRLIDTLAGFVPDAEHLPTVTWLTDDLTS